VAIRTLTPAELPDYLAFLEAGMRPRGAKTRAADDFPIALSAGNLPGLYGSWEDGELVAGLAVLVRDLATNAGPLPVAALGSVVTRADRRGEGHSRRLQAAVLADLTRQGVPLAVLWTDRPDLYAGRGFHAAGWEHHADVGSAALDGFLAPGWKCRPYAGDDLAAVVDLYGRHVWRTLRLAADHGRLYGMPGTRGLLVHDDHDRLQAYAFAGKGEDFTDYVAEWGGEPEAVAAVLAETVHRGWARRVLLPQGSEGLIALLDRQGAPRFAVASGLWAILDPEALSRAVLARVPAAVLPAPERRADPGAWLGEVAAAGEVRPGPLRTAIWGLDSV
jgi:hypothetical protein